MELAAALLLGILAGVVAGLIPGLHPNLFASLLLVYLYGIDPLLLSVFLLASGIANSFVSFIPSILLGAPEEEESLSVLPGHRMLLEGKGYEAVYLTVLGGFVSGIVALAVIPLLFFLAIWYELCKAVIAASLVVISAYFILTDKNRVAALPIFLLSGVYGLFLLNYDCLFPVFTGMFGLPLLFLSWIKKSKLPERIELRVDEKRVSLKPSLLGVLSGILAGMFPSLSPSQACVIAQGILKEKSVKGFLIACGGITTVDVILSVASIYITGNPRSGIAQAIQEALGGLTEQSMKLLILVSLLSIALSSFITLFLARKVMLSIKKLDYTRLNRTMFVSLLLLVLIFSGVGGLLITLSCFFLGLYANLKEVRKTHLMGFLTIPTILIYAGVI